MQKNIPKLRFPEFKNEWKELPIGLISSVSKLAGYEFTEHVKYSDNGEIIAIRGLNIKNNNLDLLNVKYIDNSNLSKLSRSKLYIDDLMFTYVGTIGEVALIPIDSKYYLGPNVARIRFDRSKISAKFMLEYFNLTKFKKKEVLKYIASSSQPALTMKNIRKFLVVAPSLKEQLKISTLSISIDNLINNLKYQKENLEKYKKGMMQKIFSQEIRFKDENGKDFPKWEEFNFNDILISLSTKAYQVFNSKIVNYGQFKVIDQSKELVAGYSNDDKKVFKNIPVIIFGDHTTIVKYVDFDFVVGADGTKILKNNNDANILKFIYYLIQNKPVNAEGYKRHYSILKSRKLTMPSTQEQNKISKFLTSVDKVIESKQQQIALAESWKKGLMQGMFI